MASLALKGILFGVDKIPDKWFDKIPYYRQKELAEEAEKDRRRNSSHGRNDDRKRGRRSSGRRNERRARSYDDYSEDEHDGHARRRGSRDRPDSRRAHHTGRSSPTDRPPTGDQLYGRGSAQQNVSSPTPYSPVPVNGYEATPADGYHGRTGYDHNAYRRGSLPAQYESRPISQPTVGGYVPYADIYNDQPRTARSNAAASSRAYTTHLNDVYPPPSPGDSHARRGENGDRGSRKSRHSRHDSERAYASEDETRHSRHPSSTARSNASRSQRDEHDARNRAYGRYDGFDDLE